jgi:hypothetical protein
MYFSEVVYFVFCMFVSVFAKFVMPVCGVRKFVNILHSVFFSVSEICPF